MHRHLIVICCLAAVCLTAGCATWTESHTPRTAVELMLLSTAARRSGDMISFDSLNGRKVSLDTSNFKATEQEYAVGCIRERLLEEGALLTSAEEAEVIVEARSGVLNNDHHFSMIGLPTVPVGIPGIGSTTTPEIALWSKMSQTGWSTLNLVAYEKATGRMIADSATYGTAYYNRYTVLFFITWKTSDIPERRRGAFWGLFSSVSD